MVVKEYNQFGFQTLCFYVPTFNNTTDPVYPVGGDINVFWPPLPNQPFKVRRVVFIGNLSAAGTAVVLQCNVYNGTLAGGALVVSCITTATDDAGPFIASSTLYQNPSTAKEIVTDAGGLQVRIVETSASTFTFSGGHVLIDIEYL